jgi:hypothetical protein
VVSDSINDSVRINLQRELAADDRVWSRLLDQNAQRLQLGASVLAADFGFRAAVSSGDKDTIESALDNHGARIGATVSAFLDPGFAVQAQAGSADSSERVQNLAALARADEQRVGRVALVNGRLHQFVLVPVRAPLLVGWVLMGFVVDQSLAQDMLALSGAHVVILDRGKDKVSRVVASTLPELSGSEITSLLADTGTLDRADQRFATRKAAMSRSNVGRRLPLWSAAAG